MPEQSLRIFFGAVKSIAERGKIVPRGCLYPILLAALLTSGLVYLTPTASAQEGQQPFTLTCNVTLNPQDASVPKEVDFLAQFNILTGESAVPVSVNLPVSISGTSTRKVNVSLSARPVSIELGFFMFNAPLLLGKRLFRQWGSQVLTAWLVDQKGDSFVYYPFAIVSAGQSFIPGTRVPLSVTYNRDFSRLSYAIDTNRRAIDVRISLDVWLGKKYDCEASILRDLAEEILFEEPIGFHGSRDLTFILASRNESNIHVRGSYLQSVPSLSNQRWVDLPFEFDMELNDRQPLDLGYKLASSLCGSSYGFLIDEWNFVNRSKAILPDLIAKMKQAQADLLFFNSTLTPDTESANSFALERGLELLGEVHDRLSGILTSSSMIVSPVLVGFLLVFGAILSHLLFNGNKAVTLLIFAISSLLAVEIHPGLRMLVLSLKPESLILPLIMMSASFLITSFLILGGSLSGSQVGLAVSTAVRSTRARKLRGLLTITAVAIVAIATVPSVTVKTIQQTRTEASSTEYHGPEILSLSSYWAFRRTMRTPMYTMITEGSGWFPISLSAGSFYAKNMGLREFTTICLAFYSSRIAQGSIIFANLTFLSKYLGLRVEETDHNASRGRIFINKKLDSIRSGDTLIAANMPLKVSGFFDSSTLLYLDGQPLEQYIGSSELIFQYPDWNSLLAPASSPFSKNAPNQIPVVPTPFVSPQRFKTPTPIVGIVDIGSVQDANSKEIITVLVMGVPSQEGDLAESNVKDLIFSTKNSLSQTDTQGSLVTTIDFISSISAAMASDSELKTFKTDFPVTLPLGSWASQLVLMAIGGLIIYVVILGSTVERRAESVTISSLGASPNFITFSFMTEGLILGVIGGVIGFSVGYVVAVQLGTSSPDVSTELLTLTPMVLVLVISLVTTGLGSMSPARGAILKVVPSRIMLSRDIGEVRVDNTGARRIYIPLRLRDGQVEPFYLFLSSMLSPYQYHRYGTQVYDYKKDASGIKLLIAYRGAGSISDRAAHYEVTVELVPIGNYLHVELVIRNPEGRWTNFQDYLLKEMVYGLRDEILKFSVTRE